VKNTTNAPRGEPGGSKMTVPNFLVIGARKAGTTSLYHYLDQHPEVFMSPVKEPNFFAIEGEKAGYRGPDADTRINRWSVADPKEYQALFSGADGARAVGEASPAYLCNPDAPKRIKRHVPEAKLIAVLRDPAERAYSAYMHQVRDGRETLPFAEALDAEERRTAANWAPAWRYKAEGFYLVGLSRYYELFGRERVRVYLYEDLGADPRGVMRDAYRFLGVDASFEPDTSQRHNMSGVSNNGFLVSLVRKRHPVKTAIKPLVPATVRRRLVSGLQKRVLSRPPFPPEVRRELVEAYREDVLRLEDLIGRDLSAWLRVESAQAGE
jgi:hypothetical protein